MHEIPPEDDKPKKHWLSSNPRPAPKPDPKPKPKPKPDPKPRHTAERERRQVKLAQNVPTRSPSKPGKKDDTDGCGCLILIGVIIAIGYFLFR
jgi:protein TonB